MILYHGSNCEIAEIDLAMCKPFKDFGQAFYLTTILTQAREMAKKVADRFGGDSIVNAFDFDESKMHGLNVKKFVQPDREWAEFVMVNRSRVQAHPADDLVQGMKSRKLNNPISTVLSTRTYEHNHRSGFWILPSYGKYF